MNKQLHPIVLRGAVTYPCPRYLLMVPKYSHVHHQIWSLLFQIRAYRHIGSLAVILNTLSIRQQNLLGYICCLQNGSNFDKITGNSTLHLTAFSGYLSSVSVPL